MHHTPVQSSTTPQALTDVPLEAAIEHTIEHNPSVLTPWEPPIRDQYEAFNYRELEQRLHSATLRAKELTAPAVYFRFLQDRDPSVRKLIDWPETRVPPGIDLPQEHIITAFAKYITTTGIPIHTTPTHTTYQQHPRFRLWQLHLQNVPRNTTTPQCHKQETPITIGPMPQDK